MEFAGISELWSPVFDSANEAFFCVAYGSTRRVESPDVLRVTLGVSFKNWYEEDNEFRAYFRMDFHCIGWPTGFLNSRNLGRDVTKRSQNCSRP